MNRLKNNFFVYVTLVLVLIAGWATTAEAQNRRSEREVRDIVRSLNSKIDDFQYSLTYQMRNSSADDREIAGVTADLRDLQKKVQVFSDNLDRKRENSDDVADILLAARNVDDFLAANPQNRRVQTDWSNVRSLLDRLASNYRTPARVGTSGSNYPNDRAGSNYPANNYPANNFPNNQIGAALTGTYRLDAAKSENADEILSSANVGGDAQRADLQNKLTAPDELSIEVRGIEVTLASSKGAPVTFAADGTTRTETMNGATIRLRATLRGGELTVSSVGGDTDYTVIFSALSDGNLKVTRRITTDYLRETIFADSYYAKTDTSPNVGAGGGTLPADNGSGTYSSSDAGDRSYPTGNYPTASNGGRGTYIVQNGTMLTGTLDSDINTKISQNNDRFKLSVQSPDQYRGATIEGYITGVNRSGKVSGRSQVTFNFERITLRNGQSYDFAGFLQSVTDANGKTIKVGEEGDARGDNQTNETVKRGGIGAGLGAIIGAIAGGGKGAAIGAIIGGSAGAGSVVLQGRDDLELKQGSTVTVQASSPSR